VLNTLSEQAYVLRLKSQFICDFAIPATVHVNCDGRETACEAFEEHVNSLTEFIDSRPMGVAVVAGRNMNECFGLTTAPGSAETQANNNKSKSFRSAWQMEN
jgi:hypothetical protein